LLSIRTEGIDCSTLQFTCLLNSKKFMLRSLMADLDDARAKLQTVRYPLCSPAVMCADVKHWFMPAEPSLARFE
jgi:hypothetical protein